MNKYFPNAFAHCVLYKQITFPFGFVSATPSHLPDGVAYLGVIDDDFILCLLHNRIPQIAVVANFAITGTRQS